MIVPPSLPAGRIDVDRHRQNDRLEYILVEDAGDVDREDIVKSDVYMDGEPLSPGQTSDCGTDHEHDSIPAGQPSPYLQPQSVPCPDDHIEQPQSTVPDSRPRPSSNSQVVRCTASLHPEWTRPPLDKASLQHADWQKKLDKHETSLQHAAEQGFDLRIGPVAKMWNKWLQDPEHQKEYRDVGRGYDKQRQFRIRWAQLQFQNYKHNGKQSETRSRGENERGTYESLKRIEALENDVEAAANYVQACKDLHARGIKFEDQEFVHDNMMTLRTEYLYLKTEFRRTMLQMWQDEMEWDQTPGGGGSSAPRQALAIETPPPVPRSKNPEAKLALQAKPSKPTDSERAVTGTDDGGDPSPKTRSPAETELFKLRSLKDRWMKATAEAKSLKTTIETVPSWERFKPPTALATALQALEDVRKINDFFQQWCVFDVGRLRRSFNEGEIVAQGKFRPDVERVVQMAESECSCVKEMKKSRDVIMDRVAAPPKDKKLRPAKKAKLA